MRNTMSAVSASLETLGWRYKTLALAFSYPEGPFFDCFGRVLSETERRELPEEYDRLFRAMGIWLYGAEHTAANEFEKARALADIMGFYRAAGVEPEAARPDDLTCELEFMHYLVCKEVRAAAERRGGRRKARVCRQMQQKFLADHLLPAGRAVALAVRQSTHSAFYQLAASELLDFLASEEKRLLGVPA